MLLGKGDILVVTGVRFCHSSYIAKVFTAECFRRGVGIGGDLVQTLWGRGRRVSAEKIFAVLQKCEIWWGTTGNSPSLGTKCCLSNTVYCRCIQYHIFYPLTPYLCLFLCWIQLNIEFHHINIELQVQIKAKSIIQFDNQHEFRIGNGFRLISTWISIFRYLSAPFLVSCL